METQNSDQTVQKQFQGQHDDETVILYFRRHPIAMRKGFYALLIPFVVASIPYLLFPNNLDLFWVAIGGFGVGLLLFFYHWVGWYYSIFILTDQRIRQVSQKGLFGKSVVDIGMSKIQNISYNVPGFTGEFLGFGHIVIQTYVGDLILDKIHHPETIYDTLQDVAKKAGAGTSREDINEAA